MRKLSLALVAAVVVAVPSLAAAPADAKPPKPKAELVTKKVSGSLSGGTLAVGATVKNKGNKKAGPSQTTFRLSADATASSDDAVVGIVATGKIKPKKSKQVTGSFPLPAGVAAGSYRVIACADSELAVKERKDANNCKASKATVAVVQTGPVTITAVAGAGGTVAASAITGGSCAQLVCTFPTNGTGTVTFTPTHDAGFRFKDWTGCTGYTTGPGGAITFTNPTSNQTCTANFVARVTVSWAVSGPLMQLMGTIAPTAPASAECTSNPLTGAGSCVVDAGSAVVLTATPTPIISRLGTWSATGGGSCAGVESADHATMSFSAVAADQSCLHTFQLPLP